MLPTPVFFGDAVALAAAVILEPETFCENLLLGKEKHNADQTDEAAGECADNLDEGRRIKNTDEA